MKSGSSRFYWFAWMAGGLALTLTGLLSMRSDSALATDRNPFALQRSAYGKLLARLTENTVDRVWHVGVEQIAPHEHGADCDHEGHEHGEVCEHGHGEACEHEHSEDCEHDHGDVAHTEHAHTHPAVGDEPELTHIHPHDHEDAHYHGEDIVFAVHDHEHGEESAHEGHDHSSHAGHAHEEGEDCKWCDIGKKEDTSSMSFIESSKSWLAGLSGTKYLRTNPKSMSTAHVASVKKDVENLLLRSYKMDPTHYGVYNSYHLFLTTHEFGGNDVTRKQAELIANHTIACVFQEKEDPEPWLTAAAATMNLYIMRTQPFQTAGEKIPVEILREYQTKIGFCLSKFSELQEKAEKAGIWANLSVERQLEIAEHARFTNRTFEPFEAMIARAEARERGYNAPEAEVAEILSFDGLSE